MPEMFTVHDVDTGAQIRHNRFSNPVRALAWGYAYANAHPGADFRVLDESLTPVPASRCLAIRNAKHPALAR